MSPTKWPCLPVYRLFFAAALITSTLVTLAQTTSKPNVILILADDIGYEIPSVNGGKSYSTPNLDLMAMHGMNFTHCEASPLCSPSRLMLLTGKYNFRNYSIWGYVNNGEKTIGNLMQNAGYKTAWFGKSQLLSRDSDFLNMGFEKYLIFSVTGWPNAGSTYKYKNPALYENGEIKLPDNEVQNKYGEDILTQRLFDFIDANKHTPFFAYYPMALCHTPFNPTPDDPEFASWDPTLNESDTAFFPSMVKYMDKKIGQLISKLKEAGVDKNTIVIFTGDNGTSKEIKSDFDDEGILGGKGSSTEAGTHVPLMVYWPGHIAEGSINNDLIDLTDFLPTLADISQTGNLGIFGQLDGRSFYPRLLGQAGNPRDWIFCHYDANPGLLGSAKRWAQNKTYKLYDDSNTTAPGRFYNIAKDKAEDKPLSDRALTADEKAIKQYLGYILDTMPRPPGFPVLAHPFAINATQSSIVLGASVISDGGSPVIQRGSLTSINHHAGFSFNRLADTVAGLGAFQQLRTELFPQSKYAYSLYAMNGHKSNNTGYITGTFITLSAAPKKQPASFIIMTDCSSNTVKLQWQPAVFPAAGANKAGYMLIYSTQKASVIATPDQKPPGEIVKTGRSWPLKQSNLPATPALGTTILNLSPDSQYNFLLIPYTWDGSNTATYNYLTSGALSVTGTPHASALQLQPEIQMPTCPGNSDGIITAEVKNGYSPYLFKLDTGKFQKTYVFRNVPAGTYVLSAEDKTGCTTSRTFNVPNPPPLSFVSTVTNITCIGGHDGAITVTAKGGTAPYLYSFNGHPYGKAFKFKGLGKGSFNIVIKDKGGCMYAANVILQPGINNCLFDEGGQTDYSAGLNTLTGLKVTVFPNPTRSRFQLVLSNSKLSSPADVKVFDLYGKLLEHFNGNPGAKYLFGDGFAAGIYLVQVEAGGEVKTIKVVKVN